MSNLEFISPEELARQLKDGQFKVIDVRDEDFQDGFSLFSLSLSLSLT